MVIHSSSSLPIDTMSAFSDEHFQRLSRIHNCINDPTILEGIFVRENLVISQLQTFSEDERNLLVGHLIWLYSHWPSPTSASRWTEEKAWKAMLCLRHVVRRTPEPISLNPSHAHLLRHRELLAPFPLAATTQDEIISHIWGPAWSSVLDLRTRSRHFEVWELACLSQDLGISLEAVRREVRSVQRDEEGLRMLTVQTAVRHLREVSKKVLAMEGMDEGKTERPGIVELKSWGDLAAGKISGADMFTPSGRKVVEEKMYARHAGTLVRFGDTSKRTSFIALQIC